MRVNRVRQLVLMGALGLAAGAGFLAAGLASRAPADPVCTDYWIGGSGAWSTAADWSTHAVPTTTDTACVTQNTASTPAAAADTYTVTLNNNASVGALVVGSGDGTGIQTVDVQGISGIPSTLSMAGASLVRANGVVALDSTDTVQPAILGGTGPLVNNGTVSSIVDGVAPRRIEVPLTNNATVDLAAITQQDHATATVNAAGGTWKTESSGSFTVSAGSFDNQGGVSNGGSFTATNATFTQEGTGNSGNAIFLNANVTLADSAGAGSFLTNNNNILSGTVPSGQTVTVQGISGIPSTLTLPGPVTNNGTIALDSKDTVQPAILAGTGPLVNNGTLSSIVDGVAPRRIEVPLTNNATVDLAAITQQDHATATVNGAGGTWKTESSGSFTVSAGSFDDKGSVANLGSFTVTNATFTQEGATASTGNAIFLNANVGLVDSTGGGSFLTNNNNTLSGTVPSGQTITVQGISGIPSTLSMNTAVTNHGTIVLDSTDTVQPAILGGTGSLTNAGALNTIQDKGAYRAIEVTLVNTAAGTVDIAAADTRQDHTTTVTNSGTWTVEPGGGFKDSAGSFDNQGGVSNGGSFTATNATFTQEGTGNSGNAIFLNANVTLADSAGAGSFLTNNNNILSGTVPSGQTVTVQGISGIPSTLTLPGPVTNNGTIALDSKDTVQPAILAGTGPLVNNGTLSSIVDGVAPRRIEVPLTNNATVDLAAITQQDHATATVNGAGGTWKTESSGSFTVSAGSFDDKGSVANLGSFTVTNATFTQEGATASTGNAIFLNANVGLVDSTGGGSFLTNNNNTLSGTVPSGQTITVQGISGIPSTLSMNTAVTNHGTIVLDSTDTVQPAILGGTGSLTNAGALNTIQDKGAYRAIEVTLVNTAAGTVDIAAADTRQDHTTTVTNSGTWTVEPGAAYKDTAGGWSQTTTGTLAVSLNATGSATGLTGADAVALDGTLKVTTTGSPTVGQQFTIIGTGPVTGQFAHYQFGSQAYTILYKPTSVVLTVPVPLVVTTTSLPAGRVGVAYLDATALSSSGGTGAVTWSVTSGALPDGLTLTSTTGAISGTPAADAVSESFTVTATDSGVPPQAIPASLSLTVLPALPTVTTTSLPAGQAGVAYPADTALAATGGTSPYSWAVTTGSLPDGLSLDATSGMISGTPKADAVGTASFTVTVTDSESPAQTGAAKLSITVTPPGLAVATSSLPAGQVGLAYPANTELAANGGTPPYSWAVTAGSLPDGLSLDATTGLISGTPKADAVGTASFTVQVNDSQVPTPQTATANLSITIGANPVAVTTTSLPAGQVGLAYPADTALAANGGAPPYSWAVTTGSLPDGLSLDATTGIISGTPKADAVGRASFTVTATDAASPAQTGTANLSITVTPPTLAVTTTSLPADQVGSAYPANTALAATGGTPPYSWAVTTGSLPDGLSLDATTGMISGTPMNDALGTASFTVTATDSQTPTAQTATANLSITITANPVVVATTTLPGGQVGAAYPANTALAATGGTPPYLWAVTTGALPDGLSLDATTGLISGTPEADAVGTASFTVTATDSQTPTAQTGTANLSITVNAAAEATTVTGVSPNQGLAFGGTNVTVTGSGFTGATGVSFGAKPATGVTVVNDSTIIATSPPGTNYQTVDVTVAAPGGGSATSSADQFSYTDWSVAPLPSAPTDAPTQVSCLSTTSCTATPFLVDEVYYYNGLVWTEFAGPPGATSANSIVVSASCVSATDCLAVGSTTSSGPTPTNATLAYQFNGTTWSPLASLNPPTDPRLSAVSCVSKSFCVAVGSYGSTKGSTSFIERFNGSAWTQATVPQPVGGGSDLDAVTCTSTTDCDAVGFFYSGLNIDSLAEHFNGTKWTIVPTPDPVSGVPDNELRGLSCTSATNCTAVEDSGFAVHFNGTSWSLLPNPPSGALGAVSCASATDCTAVGTVSIGTTPSPALIAHWDGSAWTVVGSPTPDAVGWLESVDCRTSTFCIAVGTSGTGFTSGFFGFGVTSPQPLIEMRTALSLTGAVAFPTPGQSDTLTATSAVDVGSIGSALDIVDTGTGKVVGSCATGTTCTAAVILSGTTIHTYIAEIGTSKGANVTAISAPLQVSTATFSLSLTASSSTPALGQAVTLTATATSDVSAAGSPLRIVDTTTNKTVGSCSSGLTCSASVLVTAGGVHTYQAVITGKAKVSSAPVSVTWQAMTLSLMASPASPAAGQPVVLTATANFSPGAFGVPIKIVDLANNHVLAQCSSTPCTAQVDHFDGIADTYQATIAGVVQLKSTIVSVTWPAVTLTLTASTTSPAPNVAVTVTATSGVSLNGTGDSLVIVDTTTNKVVGSVVSGTTDTATVKFATGSHTYAAQVRPSGSTTAQVTSAPVTVTW